MLVGSDGHTPSFAYTVGLSGKDLPELMVIGLPPDTAQYLLNKMAKMAIERTLPRELIPIPEVVNLPVALRADDDESTMAGLCNLAQVYSQEERGTPCKVAQVVIPDEDGRFPWELGCAQHFINLQNAALLAQALEDPEGPSQYPTPRQH